MESSWDLHWIPQLFDGLQREWNLVSDKIIQHYDKYIDKTDRLNLLGPFNIENKMIISKSWHSCDGSCCILPTVETDKGKSLLETGWDYWTGSVSVQCQQFFKKGKENTPTLSSWYLKKIYTKTTTIKSSTQFSLSLEHLTDNMFVYFLTNRKLNTVVNLPATPSC